MNIFILIPLYELKLLHQLHLGSYTVNSHDPTRLMSCVLQVVIEPEQQELHTAHSTL